MQGNPQPPDRVRVFVPLAGSACVPRGARESNPRWRRTTIAESVLEEPKNVATSFTHVVNGFLVCPIQVEQRSSFCVHECFSRPKSLMLTYGASQFFPPFDDFLRF